MTLWLLWRSGPGQEAVFLCEGCNENLDNLKKVWDVFPTNVDKFRIERVEDAKKEVICR